MQCPDMKFSFLLYFRQSYSLIPNEISTSLIKNRVFILPSFESVSSQFRFSDPLPLSYLAGAEVDATIATFVRGLFVGRYLASSVLNKHVKPHLFMP
jgi:hypothetical protein